MRIVALSALALLPGCSFFIPQWEGVWLFELPVVSDGSTDSDYCSADCDENFDDASCYEVEGGDSDWTYEFKGQLSPGAYFVEVFNGKGGEVFAVVNDQVYVGEATVKQLTLQWEGLTDVDDRAEHDEGYEYRVIDVTRTLEKVTITKAPKNDHIGEWLVQTDSEVEYVETDEWDPLDVPVFGGQIPSFSYLEADEPGGNVNGAESNECSGGECELTISYACDYGKRGFTVSYAGKYENGMFEGIRDAGRDPGAQGGGAPQPPTTTSYGY